MQPAGMLQQETLQQLGIEAIHVMNQFVETVLVAAQAEAQGHFAERGMLVYQQAGLVMSLNQAQSQMYRQRGGARSAFGPHQGNDSALLSRRLSLMPGFNMRQRFHYLVRLERLDQIFRAAGAHCRNNLVRPGVAGRRKQTYARVATFAQLAANTDALLAIIEVDNANSMLKLL